MILIELTQGKKAKIDEWNIDIINKYNWYAALCRGHWYAKAYDPATKKKIYMHRLIVKTRVGLDTDHYDGDGLNNLESNLRVCTHSVNIQNQFSKKRFKGVFLRKRDGTFMSQIRIKGITIHLGTYKTEEEAALKYNEYAIKLYGEKANLNII